MRFEEKFKDVEPGCLSSDGNYLRAFGTGVCAVCGKPCKFIEINYEAFFCSEECEDEETRELFGR